MAGGGRGDRSSMVNDSASPSSGDRRGTRDREIVKKIQPITSGAWLKEKPVQDALASISRFLTQVGLSATARSLTSEVEKKGGNVEVIHLSKKTENKCPPTGALDRLLLAVLNPGHSNNIPSNTQDSKHAVVTAVSLVKESKGKESRGTIDDSQLTMLPGSTIEDNLATTVSLDKRSRGKETGEIMDDSRSRVLPGHTEEDDLAGAIITRRKCCLISRLRSAECGAPAYTSGRDKDLFRLARSQPVALLRGHREALVNLEILDGRSDVQQQSLVFSASLDNTLRLWNVSEGSGECQAVMRAPGGQLSDARVLSEGKYAACCTEDGKTYLVDMTHSRCLEEFDVPRAGSYYANDFEGVATMAVSKDSYEASTLIAAATKERCIPIWDTRHAAASMVLQRSRAIRGSVRGLHFGAHQLLCHGSQSSVIWDLRMQQIVTTLQTTSNPSSSSSSSGCSSRSISSRVPDRMLFLPCSRSAAPHSVVVEFGSEYAGRHRPSPAIQHRLFSTSSGLCTNEYTLPYGTPSTEEGDETHLV